MKSFFSSIADIVLLVLTVFFMIGMIVFMISMISRFAPAWLLKIFSKTKKLIPRQPDNLMLSDTITPKKMFYNTREAEAVRKLASLLQEENFRKIQDSLNLKGMRKGFACLFSGEPGTGKTETAYQIARETKRNIIMVDIPKIKGCFFGENAKNIQDVFEMYKNEFENSAIAPILLFNEADAVVGKRIEYSSASRAVDRDENATQNVLLQEMENFSGILIATTNFTQNMDKAFERRFLYKINFEKPTMESRRNIWKTLLPDLPEGLTGELSGRFALSGGQIENIARKTEVETIINSGVLSMNTIVQFCRDETMNSHNVIGNIGFVNG